MANQPVTYDPLLERLRDIVTSVLELEPDELTDTSDFVAEHEADSLAAIEILSRIERDLGVEIPAEALPEMANLRAVRDVVVRCSPGGHRDA
jgi:acyl carrier protein